jgi:hypothetical protein
MECVRQVRALGIAPGDRDLILGGHAEALLNKQRQPAAAQ